MRKLFKNKEKKHLNINIFEWDIDVYIPENEEQRYIKAAENVSKKKKHIWIYTFDSKTFHKRAIWKYC